MGKGKPKAKGKGKPNQGKSLPQRQSRQDEPIRQEQFIPLQDRIAAVKPFWRALKQEERQDVLTVSMSDLVERARIETEKQQKQAAIEEQMYPEDTITIDLEPSPSDTLQLGLDRLKTRSTWKLWQWPDYDNEFLDAESFRTFVETERMTEEMRITLPRDSPDGKPTTERPAEKELRERMSALLQKVHNYNRNLQEQEINGAKKSKNQRMIATDQGNAAIREANTELIMMMMESFERENEHLYRSVLFPITKAICELLDPQQRESKCNDLSYDDFDKMHPDDVARFCEWLTEKVDGYSSKIKLEAKDMEEEGQEEGIGDVDLFTMIDHPEKGRCLVVNAKWLQHLQDRVLGEDGQPRKMKDDEDPDHIGLVLEWVYGTIVSTAEKARDGAKRLLGTSPPTVHMAFDMLDAALKEQSMWEEKHTAATKLLKETISYSIEASGLVKEYPEMNPAKQQGQPDAGSEPPNLPDEVIKFLLRREVLLTEAKMMTIDFEKYKYDKELRSLKVAMRQGEPEFERLKREMDELKQTHRKLDGPFRTTHEMERHQTQQQDQQVEEQLQVQTQFREHSSKLQNIFDKRQRVEVDITRKVSEERQLVGWKDTVRKLIDKFDELSILGPSTPPNGREHPIEHELENGDADEETANQHKALMNAARESTGQAASLQKLRNHFHKDVRRQFYSEDDDISFKKLIKAEIKTIEKIIEDGRAVLQLLEMHLVNVACNDPGAVIGNQLILPMLQERLDEENRKAAERDSEIRAADVLKNEEDTALQKRLAEEKKLEKKRKQDEKARAERERLAAEQAEREEAERLEAEAIHRRHQEEQDRIRAEKEREKSEQRKVEEAAIEARRRELSVDKEKNAKELAALAAAQGELRQSAALAESKLASEHGSSDLAKATDEMDDDEGFQQQMSSRHNRRLRGQKTPEDQNAPPGLQNRPRPETRGNESRDLRDGRGRGRHAPNDNRTLPMHRPGRVISVRRNGNGSPQQEAPVRPDPQEASRPKTPPPQETQKQSPRPHTVESPVHQSPTAQASRIDSASPSPTPPSHQGTSSPAQANVARQSPASQSSHEGSIASRGSHDTSRPVTGPATPAEQPHASLVPGPEAAKDVSRPETHECAAPAEPKVGEDRKSLEAAFANGVSPNTPQQIIPPNSIQPPSGERNSYRSPPVSSVLPLEAKVQIPLFVIGPPKESDGAHQHAAPAVPQSSGQIPHSAAHGSLSPSTAGMQFIHAHPSGEHGRYRTAGKLRSEPPFVPPASNAPQGYGVGPRGGRGSQLMHDQFQHQGGPPQGSMYGPRGQSPMQPGAVPNQYGGPVMMPNNPQGMAQPMMYPPQHMPPYQGHGMEGRGLHGQPQQWHSMGPHGGNGYGVMQQMQFPMQHREKRNMEVSSVTGYSPGVYGQPQQPGFRAGAHPGYAPHQPPTNELYMQRSDELPNFQGNVSMTRRGSQQSGASMPRTGSIPASSTMLNAAAMPFVPTARAADSGQVQRPQAQPARSSPLSHTVPAFDSNQAQTSGPQDTGLPAVIQSHPTEQVIVTPTRQDAEKAAQENAFRRQQEAQSRSASHAELPALSHGGAEQASAEEAKPSVGASVDSRHATESKLTGQESRSEGTAAVQKDSLDAMHRERSHQEAESSYTNSPTSSSTSSQTKSAAHWSNYRPPADSGITPHTPGSSHSKSSSNGHLPGLSSDHAGRAKQKRSTPRNLSSSSLGKEEAAGQSRESESIESRLQRQSRSPGALADSPRLSLAVTQRHSSPPIGLTLGGVVWKFLSRDEIERLSLARGLENKTGTNNCFLNVVIQALWHTSPFREQFLQLDAKDATRNGAPQTDVAVFTALHSILAELAKLRTALRTVEGSDAKRIKLEEQDKAAESQEPELLASPNLLRQALSKVFDISNMHDASELMLKLLESLHLADLGSVITDPEPQLPKRLEVPVNASGLADAPEFEYDHSIVHDIIVQLVQIPETVAQGVVGEPEEQQQAKRSKGTGGAVVDRWQTQTSRPQKSQHSPSVPQTSSAKPRTKEFWRYCQPIQNITTREFTEAVKDNSIMLFNCPQVYVQSLGWESDHVANAKLEAVLKALDARIHLSRFFGSVPESSPAYELQAIICFCGHHYQSFVYSHEIKAWLLINDIEITKVGNFGDVKQTISKSSLLPNVLFYERA